jgi:hypothetical protein
MKNPICRITVLLGTLLIATEVPAQESLRAYYTKGSKGESLETEIGSWSVEEGLSFTLRASEDHRLQNPCFVIRNWQKGKHADLEINGKRIPAAFRLY